MLNLLSELSGKRKTMLRELGRKVGLEVRLNALNARNDLRLAYFLKVFNIDLVLDIGANRGQFAQELFNTGYSGRVVSFEALPDAHKRLKEAAERQKYSWIVAPRVALSDQPGTAQFHVTEADTSSSLFAPKESFVASTPQARPVEVIEVPTARLDDIVGEIGLSVENCFLKMDVQGGESLVLAGAPNVLGTAKGLMTELSLRPLYDGQPSAQRLLEAIYEAGFEIWDVWQGYRDPRSHRLNQIDIVCFKPNKTSSLA
ncbi:FkbM family methyltransferase [Mesorhizobium sp. M0410]|uniref:FkbM family methyltransferase n=1 Tax=Mesorhizobium sp. M0410 TaxID=2956943 RepID=UPI0033396FB1